MSNYQDRALYLSQLHDLYGDAKMVINIGTFHAEVSIVELLSMSNKDYKRFWKAIPGPKSKR